MTVSDLISPSDRAGLATADAFYCLIAAVLKMSQDECEVISDTLRSLAANPDGPYSPEVRDWWLHSARLLDGMRATADAVPDSDPDEAA